MGPVEGDLPLITFAFRCRATALALLALLLGAAPATAITLPADFVAEPLPFTFDVPTSIAFLPDGGLLVAEKGGIVYLVRGASRYSFWVHEEEVLNADDSGLLSIAVDPNFAVNRYVYFLYTVDPDSNGVELDNHDDAFGRLTRYRVSAGDPNRVDESTRTVLIGRTWREGFPCGSGAHTIADLAWGRDGTLLVAAGEGSHHDITDAGGHDPGLFAPGRTDPAEDIGAFRAQDPASLAGKVLRVDPATGLGLPSNPYFDGDPASNRSRVWAYGLRNPFRITVEPGTGSTDPAAGDPGTLFIADVGWATWEEISVADGPGRNFGWPCFEGPAVNPDYQGATPSHHDCTTPGTPENPAMPTTPIASWHHWIDALSAPTPGESIVLAGGVFQTAAGWPAPWRGAYFAGDYGLGWIGAVTIDGQNQATEVVPFATEADGPVDFIVDPATGDLAYIALATESVVRIRYTGAPPPPPPPPVPPAALALGPPRPNPSRGSVTLALETPTPARVDFAIHDVVGRQVWREGDRDAPAGRIDLAWPGVLENGGRAPAGVYLAVVRVGAERLTRRFVLMP